MNTAEDIVDQDLCLSDSDEEEKMEGDFDSSDSENQHQVHHTSSVPITQDMSGVLNSLFRVMKKPSKQERGMLLDDKTPSKRTFCLVDVLDNSSFEARKRKIGAACNITIENSSSSLPSSKEILAADHVIICRHNSRVDYGMINLQMVNLSEVINRECDMASIWTLTCFEYLETHLLGKIDDIYVNCDYHKVDEWSHLILWFLCYAWKLSRLNNISIYLSGAPISIINDAFANVLRFYETNGEHNGCWSKFAVQHNKEAEEKAALDSFLKSSYGCTRLTDVLKKNSITGVSSTSNVYRNLKESFIFKSEHMRDSDRIKTFDRKLSDIGELCLTNDGHPPGGGSMHTLNTIMLSVLDSTLELKFVGDGDTCCRTVSSKCLLSILDNKDDQLLDAMIKDLLGVSLGHMTSSATHKQSETTVVTIKLQRKHSTEGYDSLINMVIDSIENIIAVKLGTSFKTTRIQYDDQTYLLIDIRAYSLKFPPPPLATPEPKKKKKKREEDEDEDEEKKKKTKKIKKKIDC